MLYHIANSNLNEKLIYLGEHIYIVNVWNARGKLASKRWKYALT